MGKVASVSTRTISEKSAGRVSRDATSPNIGEARDPRTRGMDADASAVHERVQWTVVVIRNDRVLLVFFGSVFAGNCSFVLSISASLVLVLVCIISW